MVPKKKVGEFHSVTFRLRAGAHDLLMQVAQARGQDLTAVINGLIAEALPGLQRWLLDRATMAKDLEAVVAGLPDDQRRILSALLETTPKPKEGPKHGKAKDS